MDGWAVKKLLTQSLELLTADRSPLEGRPTSAGCSGRTQSVAMDTIDTRRAVHNMAHEQSSWRRAASQYARWHARA